jgi:hypothetical protein
MTTITEDYISFEIAKLLKEKGFNEECFALYNPDGVLIQSGIRLNNIQVGRVEGSYSAPTLQMTMKWLREVYNFHIWVEPSHDKEGLYNAHVKVGWWSNNWAGVGYNTYEKATEEAIKYCLKHLIK